MRLNERSIADYAALPIEDALAAFKQVKLQPREELIAGTVLKEVRDRLSFLHSVGLGYITLDRPPPLFRAAKVKRIRLATQIGSQLRGRALRA